MPAGVNWALGYPDGEKIGREMMLEAVRIAGGVSVPVTADMVAGFGATPEDAAETVRGVIEAGVSVSTWRTARRSSRSTRRDRSHVDKIVAARAAAMTVGVPVVINAAPTSSWPRSALRTRGSITRYAAPTHIARRVPIASSFRRSGLRDHRPTGPVDHRPGQHPGPREQPRIPELARLGVAGQRRLRPDAGSARPAPANRNRATRAGDLYGHDRRFNFLCGTE